ncbi:imidazole glycerol phosphate synthase subunit HisH [bacterium]|nr:imidazole glycerol phosphate synthase subunit HisH [bacterium]
MKIAVIDYDIGNVKSILNALSNVGVESILTRDEEILLNSDGVVLPGVGAFSHGMDNLKKYNLIDIINNYIATNKPFLGICLGMQLLLEKSEEFGLSKGLGIINGTVKKLIVKHPDYQNLPHVSWNELHPHSIPWEETILDGVKTASDVYFVHSYVAQVENNNNILSCTTYSDNTFCSAVKKDNVYGVQFHPEKSGDIGLHIIKKFVNICDSIRNKGI